MHLELVCEIMKADCTTVFVFVLCVMAVFRLATLFSKEMGPGRIFERLRKVAPPRSTAREGLSCPFCWGVWWAAVATGYTIVLGYVDAFHAPLWWLAVSAGAVACNQMFTKGEL